VQNNLITQSSQVMGLNNGLGGVGSGRPVLSLSK